MFKLLDLDFKSRLLFQLQSYSEINCKIFFIFAQAVSEV